MRISFKNGIRIEKGEKTLSLDPHRKCEGSVVTHAHLDHLMPGAVMTPQTLDVMKVRKGTGNGTALDYHEPLEIAGFEVMLKEAGHVFGSAMVRADGVLYTGDLSPQGGLTCGKGIPEKCDILIMESTYGKPEYRLPPKELVVRDLMAWAETELAENSVAIGAYQFGKAQEVIALLNSIGQEVFVTEDIAEISEVYVKHGIELKFRKISDMGDREKKEPHAYVVPGRFLKKEMDKGLRELRHRGLRTAYVSGWCAVYNLRYGYNLDAQFPLSDHGDFDDLLWFAEECSPEKVYTCHGSAKELAQSINSELGIDAEPLEK